MSRNSTESAKGSEVKLGLGQRQQELPARHTVQGLPRAWLWLETERGLEDIQEVRWRGL